MVHALYGVLHLSFLKIHEVKYSQFLSLVPIGWNYGTQTWKKLSFSTELRGNYPLATGEEKTEKDLELHVCKQK